MRKTLLLISLLVIVVLTTLSSCKKNEPVPDFPQLIGHWSGTNSQGSQIRFVVNNIKGYLYITEYHLTIYTSAGYHEYQSGNSNGIGIISNKQFKIHLATGSSGEAYIDGTFDLNSMSLYGNFAVYDPGGTTDLITGTYSCSMGTK